MFFAKKKDTVSLPGQSLESDIETGIPDNRDAQIEAALEIVQQLANGDFGVRITNIEADGKLGELFYGINDLVDRCDAYIRESAACLDHVSQGKYYRKIIETSMVGSYLDASRKVNSALDAMQQKVNDFALVTSDFEKTVGEVVETVSSSATELEAASESMSSIAKNTTDQATAVTADALGF